MPRYPLLCLRVLERGDANLQFGIVHLPSFRFGRTSFSKTTTAGAGRKLQWRRFVDTAATRKSDWLEEKSPEQLAGTSVHVHPRTFRQPKKENGTSSARATDSLANESICCTITLVAQLGTEINVLRSANRNSYLRFTLVRAGLRVAAGGVSPPPS